MSAQVDAQDSVATLFKALMHPARIAILDLLRGGAQCVCHLEARLGLRQAYVSQQLSVLRDAGIVVDERDGLNIYYHVANPSIYTLLDVARVMTNAHPYTLSDSAAPCPCPKCAANAAERKR